MNGGGSSACRAIGRLGAGTAAVLCALAVPAGAVSAQCDIDAGRDTFDVRAHSATAPIVLRADDVITLERPADGALGVAVWFGPVPIPVLAVGDEGRTITIDLADYDWIGVGLYRVDLVGPGAGECGGTVWVRLEGGSPFTTAAGIASIAVLAGGLALVVQSVRRGQRGRCSTVRGAVGGMLSGIGLGALAQQILLLPMLLPLVGALLVVPSVIGGLLANRACAPFVATMTLTPILVAPRTVLPGEDFEVRVGVGIGAPLGRQRRQREVEHRVTAQLVCAGAAVPAGQTWTRDLVVRAGAKASETVVPMRATREVGESYLTALYASGGQTVGVARRSLWVAHDEDGVPPPEPTEPTTPFSVPVLQPPVDLELRATFAGPRALHVMQLTIETPHRDRVMAPDEPVTVDLGGAPEAFAAGLMRNVADSDGKVGLHELLLGAGRQLGQLVDPSVLTAVREVLDLVPHPRVLVMSEESAVPWELAAIEPAPDGEPPFLATRAGVGRWYLRPGATCLPPPIAVPAGERRVLATSDLPYSQVEARRLTSDMDFRELAPTVAGLLDSLERAGTVHVACHGSWRVDEDRIILHLSDGNVVPMHIAGLRLQQHPFVFFNSCQVAAGGEVLGMPAGFPAELVFAGGSGCVMPLWSVRDDEASEIAVEFYRQVFAGRTPAEVISEQRRAVLVDGRLSATPFAYQFIGHPDLHLA